MTPLYFGDSKQPLFGFLNEPRGETQRAHGVLLCPPIAQEHVRAHWALRQVATSLCRAGFHVLRFDWFGVGDSAGDLSQATVARWRSDLETAAQELKDAAGVRKVSLVGLRLGATLAALSAPVIKPTALVLWDAVQDGSAYLAELKQLEKGILADERRFWVAWPASVRATVGKLRPDVAQARHPAADELVGFAFPGSLREQIGELSLDGAVDVGRSRVFLLDSSGEPGSTRLLAHLQSRGAKAELRTTQAEGRWSDPRQVEELLLPGDAVQTITDALETATS
ncbi:MAG: alpha/beta hydrolase [Myxococcales bacterium]|nr:alpha/beta hydrolase [Myxococcales bacterium]